MRENRRGELVAAFGHVESEFIFDDPVQLGGTSCARSRSTSLTPILNGQDARLRKLVEMKGCDRPRDAKRGSRLVAADWLGGSNEIQKQPSTQRLDEGYAELQVRIALSELRHSETLKKLKRSVETTHLS
ncbi:MAG TPA: hypothetical protein VMF35_13715 [Acidimicrobiales bacterium]|nr:hypothetical protein [Acidimicrobiales bacterium]